MPVFRKPVPLSRVVMANKAAAATAAAAVCPPITGVNSNFLPYSNIFDDSGAFRGRSGSGAKRPRTESEAERDAIYDLSRNYPPLICPDKPSLDPTAIKSLLVSATEMTGSVKPLLDQEVTSPAMKSMISLSLLMLSVLEAVVEKGIEPLSSAAAGGKDTSSGRNFLKAYQKRNAPPAVAAKPPPPGKKELVAALEKSELESVIFGANLGSAPLSNRDILSQNFTIDIAKKTHATCEKKDKDTTEPLRLVEDALSCVENMEFIGGRSEAYTDRRRNAPPSEGEPFCSMPVKVTFSDRQSRINFEKTLSEYAGVRASQSYPKPVRNEMTLFRKALQDRYPDMVIMTRPDNANPLNLAAFMKKDGDRKWTPLPETHALPLNIMLSSYSPPNHIVLPDPVSDCPDGAIGGGESAAADGDDGMNCD
jgi:hypothetical protein